MITYGDQAAIHTLDLYEDMRCPYCATFERDLGPALRELADQGAFKIEYHVVNFLDRGNAEGGSTSALAALRAAQEHSTPDDLGNESGEDGENGQSVVALRTALLYNLPEADSSVAFADPHTLLAIAGTAPGVRNAVFDQAVLDGTYREWAVKTGAAALESLKAAWTKAGQAGSPGVPAAFLDGAFLDLMRDYDTVTLDQLADIIAPRLG